ncbi:MAG: hypothetical protein KAY46_03900 [Burkholderiaceae bacterium]|nr:hypothetical protein [Burkholderiaceae bacterium]MBP8306381.1 hypothetical protein [Burkholderiaceae bacterium]
MNATETTAWVECSECARLFERAESEAWKRRCIGCWKRSKTTERASAPDPYAAGYAAGRAEGLAERMAAHQRGFEAGRAHGRAEAPRSAPVVGAIDKTRMRQLLQLAHPDKHEQSALANEITAWLLSLREAVK